MTWPRIDGPAAPPVRDDWAHPADEYDWIWLGPDNPITVQVHPADTAPLTLPTSRDFPSSTAQDVVRNGGRWVLTRGLYAAWWIEEHCLLPDGPKVGQRMTLLPWMVRRLIEKHECHPDTGLRRFRWTLTGVGKKNSKTTAVAGEGHFYLHGDGHPAPKIVIAASADHQADLIYDAAKFMAEQPGPLQDMCNPQHRRILSKLHSGRMTRVAAATGTRDGLSTSTNLFDELHTWDTKALEDQFTILSGATATHPEAVNDLITTAGYNKDTVLGRYYDQGVKLREGAVEDDTFYFLWYEIPAKADITDEATWPLGNPSIGVTFPIEYLRDRMTKLRPSEWRRYHANQWTEVEEVWDVAEWWDGLPADGPSLLLDDRPTFVGIDASIRRDSTAVVAAQMGDDGHVYTESRVWQNPYPPDDQRYQTWRVPTGELTEHLIDLFERFQEYTREDAEGNLEPGPAFFYDPAYFHWLADELRDEGLNMIEYPQTDTRMIPASQTFYLLAKEAKLHHDGNPTYREHVRNVVAKETGRGWRMSKLKGSTKKIDTAIAGGIAAHEAVVGPVDGGCGIW